jgi:hypothetical protein
MPVYYFVPKIKIFVVAAAAESVNFFDSFSVNRFPHTIQENDTLNPNSSEY